MSLSVTITGWRPSEIPAVGFEAAVTAQQSSGSGAAVCGWMNRQKTQSQV